MSDAPQPWLTPLYRVRPGGCGRVCQVPGEDVPEPFRRLLVHEGDMTSRLEAFHEDSIQLEVLRVAEMDEQILEREVLLRRQRDGRVVEYGAIEIHVDIFSEGLRALITQGKLPLGGLLNHNGVSYFSEPSAFFSVVPSPVLCGLLNSREDALLYGRANVLRRSDGALIARIVEILPSCAGEC